MNDELGMEVEIVNDNNEEVLDTNEYSEESGGGNLGKIMVVAAIGVVGLGIACYRKNRGKLDQMRIKRLEKKGYQVYKIDDVYDEEDFDEESNDDTDN